MIFENYRMEIFRISLLLNANDYYVNLRLIMFISSCFEINERQIDLTFTGILDKSWLSFISMLKLYPDN